MVERLRKEGLWKCGVEKRKYPGMCVWVAGVGGIELPSSAIHTYSNYFLNMPWPFV